MDSRQLFKYSNGTGAGFSYSNSPPSFPSPHSRLIGSLKLDIGHSPNTPFSTQFDCESVTTLSDSQEQQSSSDNISGRSSSCNRSLESRSFPGKLSISRDYHHRDAPASTSAGTSCVADAACSQETKHALLKLENVLMGPDEDEEVSMLNITYGGNARPQELDQRSSAWIQQRHQGSTTQFQPLTFAGNRQPSEGERAEKRLKSMVNLSMRGLPPGDLTQLLVACARALSEYRIEEFDRLIEKARGFVSIAGEPMQRLGAYVVEALVARKGASGSSIYGALRCNVPEGKELLSYMQVLYDICPYLKFGYMAANGAIAEACRNEDRIHIIDFQIAQGTQWVTLLQALAARPSGAPYVKITGIDDPVSKYARGEGLEAVGRRLRALSEKFKIPVEFHGVPGLAPNITPDLLDIRPGEALAVNFPLQLHHTPDESVDVNNPRDGLLRMVKSLSPKVTTLVEQEFNTNTAPFLTRFSETLDYYLAVFESIDVTLSRDRKERINVEQHCLARDIVNVIACEGKERVERHELFGKWKSRLTMAGFKQYPLSSYVNSVIKTLLRSYSEHYTLLERDDALFLGWKDRNLISASAWH